jgi:hypothetical protein
MAAEPENNSGSGIIGGASLGISVSNIFLRAARTLGRRLSPLFVRAGAHLGNAASIGAVAYEVYSENGLEHKGERAAAGLVSAGVNIGLGGAAATAGETAALTGVAGATGATVAAAAAPVALSVIAAGATAKTADLAIENRRVYEALDRDTARDAAPQKVRNRLDDAKPSMLDYKHIAAMRGVTALMRDGALHASGLIERFAASGRMRNLAVLDMTDPVNLAEYERALNEEIARQQTIMTANDSFLPRWIRHGDSVNRYNFAAGELENLLGAREELAMLRQDIRRYNERCARGGVSTEKHEIMAAGTKGQTAPDFNAAVAGASPAQGSGQVSEQPKPPRPGRPIAPS